MEEQPAWKVILLNIVGGIIVNNLLSTAVTMGLPKIEGGVPFQGMFLQTTLIAIIAGGIGGLVLSLSLMFYYPAVTPRYAAVITALWAGVLGVLWAVVVVWGLSTPMDSAQGLPMAIAMVLVPPLSVVTGWALTARLVNGYLTSLEGRLMAAVVAVFSLLNLLTMGGVFAFFSDSGIATVTGLVFGGILGAVMTRMMSHAAS